MAVGCTDIGGIPYSVTKTIRICCCGAQTHLSDQDAQKLVAHPEWQLRNLEHTFAAHIKGCCIYDIREFFHDSEVPFRFKGCSRSSLSCCGSCTRMCLSRCPQDVLNRAYLFCVNILNADSESKRIEQHQKAGTMIQMLYDELVSPMPRYLTIASTVTHMMSPYYNKKLEKEIYERYHNEDTPHRLDYAPVISYESVPGSNPMETKFRKKVNVETGEVELLDWPRSGMCPFCLPTGLSEKRRKR